jgi:hypothetical protein
MEASNASCPQTPLRRFRVRSDVTVWATDYSEAQTVASSAAALWSNETGFEHLHGFGDPRGSVVVETIVELVIEKLVEAKHV